MRYLALVLPYVFKPISLGSIKPQGWMKDQIALMADGLGGHQYDFYHYFNAIVPLAYGSDDARLKQQVNTSIDYIMSHQYQDGWIRPESTPQTRFFWPRTLVLMGLTQFLEAVPEQAPSIVPCLYKFLELSRTMLADNYLGYIGRNDSKFDYHWGITRSQDMILSLQWLHDNYPEGNEQLLLDAYFYSEAVFPKKDLDIDPPADEDLFWYYHGVNSAMGLKAGAVVRRFTHNDTLLDSTRCGYNWTIEYHGSPSGTIIGDEPWSGLSPTRGSEVCTAVETMFSLGYLHRALGDYEFADRAELAAFNALPAAVIPDWWAHQYMTQINQPFSHNLSGNPFADVNTLGQTFGQEPNYPCCTVNHPQGYPKFLASAYVRAGSNGIGHTALFPSTLTTILGSGKVTIDCVTNYPFSNILSYTIKATAPFDFHIRVPAWATSNSTISLNAVPQPLQPDSSTRMHTLSIPAGTSKVLYTLGASIRVVPRQRSSVNIYHGALLYAIPITANITSDPAKESRSQQPLPAQYTTPKSKDYIMENTTAWNIAIDPSTLKYFETGDGTQNLPNPIWDLGAPPNKMTAKGCYIVWGLEKGVRSDPPVGNRTCLGDAFEVEMVPCESAKLHMAELPTVDLA
ncbi:hypothetical protein F5882DRAFT_454822 [Hyaloscypha sp. PMI_1271]|nr:hypothetical protein F5882DRAFT_454822 [Hyaloscypha sp. PMI_1271]